MLAIHLPCLTGPDATLCSTRQFKENSLKTEGSIRSYGASLRPDAVGIEASTLRCTAPPPQLYEGLREEGRERAVAAEEYLLSRSVESIL